jgi:hypothetical protein
MPYIGKSPSAGVRQRYQYTATAGQTTFSGTDTGNLTLNYTDNNFVDVFQNGVLLKGSGTDYTATSGSSVVLTTGASVSDVIEIIVYDVFSVGNFYSRTDSDSRYALTTGATMSGALDLNGQELILDADADTSITADTDDQIDIKIAGSDSLRIKANEIENVSGDLTLDVEGDIILDADGGDFVFKDGGSGDEANKLIRFSTPSHDTDEENVQILQVENEASSNQISFGGGTSALNSATTLRFLTSSSVDTTTGTERMRIDSSGNVLVGKTAADQTVIGAEFRSNGIGAFTANGSAPLRANRKSSDGNVVNIVQDDTTEGSISVSGSTVTYGGFSGLHESSGIATNTPIGTVVSTIDELDTYPTGTTRAGQTRADHAKVEVSDTVGDSAVYGIVSRFDEHDKVFVASVGIGSVRVTGACAKGDLLESNGDGTAKVQDDDIVRSKTIGKVTIGNSNTGVKLVSCVLYCG